MTRLDFRRLLGWLLASVLLASSASATWSICVVNRRTGEVAVASATCITIIDLMSGLPVVRVGEGVGAIQSAGWSPGLVIMYDLFPTGATPQEILDAVNAAAPNRHNLQIGIASMTGSPVTYSGRQVGQAKGGVVGEVGDLAYAIQGNVLTGSPVWLDAEAALLGTPGDLTERLMAAMEAAYAAGGDGRCSCDPINPTDCGAPPDMFRKSAHVGFMIVARIGDQDPTCNQGDDCAPDGRYYLKLNIKGGEAQFQDPDPVLQLRAKYETWKQNRVGQADALLSLVEGPRTIPADGATRQAITVRLIDREGTPLSSGGDDVQVATVDGGPSLSGVGPVQDHGDGSYSFELAAGMETGVDRFAITAQAGQRRVTLYPYLEVRSEKPMPLRAGVETVSASAGADVPFSISVPDRAGAYYRLVGSLSGTEPGTDLGRFHVPLNPDSFTRSTVILAGDPDVLPGSVGRLDVDGRAAAAFRLEPAQLFALVGMRIDWACVVFGRGPGLVVTNPVGFDVVP